MAFRRIFKQTGPFEAMNAAEAFLRAAGFSVGSTQRGDPRGILFGDYDIQKWRNLRAADRAALHGQMTGNMRDGPAWITLAEKLPDDAHRALDRVLKSEGAI